MFKFRFCKPGVIINKGCFCLIKNKDNTLFFPSKIFKNSIKLKLRKGNENPELELTKNPKLYITSLEYFIRSLLFKREASALKLDENIKHTPILV